MRRTRLATLFAAAAATAFAALPASAATIINLDARANGSPDASNAITLSLDAGRYTLSFVEDQFTAFNVWSTVSGCDSAGEHCAKGWNNRAHYIIDGVETVIGGRGDFPDGYYRTAAQSLASTIGMSWQFVLDEATDVKFYINDTPVTDNSGGVSLRLAAAVPEPASWALLISGFGLIGASLRRRRQTLVTAG